MNTMSHRKKECSLNKSAKVSVVGWDMGNVKSVRDTHYPSTLLTQREKAYVTMAGFKVNSVLLVLIINNN